MYLICDEMNEEKENKYELEMICSSIDRKDAFSSGLFCDGDIECVLDQFAVDVIGAWCRCGFSFKREAFRFGKEVKVSFVFLLCGANVVGCGTRRSFHD